jgi:hypothetical protein
VASSIDQDSRALHSAGSKFGAANVGEGKAEVDDSSPQKLVVIISSDGTRFSLAQDSHFLKSSGFLTKLHLQAGDRIKLNVIARFMKTALEFYEEDANNPFPEIRPPILEEDGGGRYEHVLSDMAMDELFDMTLFCDLMEMEKLCDLCCFRVTFRILNGRG